MRETAEDRYEGVFLSGRLSMGHAQKGRFSTLRGGTDVYAVVYGPQLRTITHFIVREGPSEVH